MASEVANASSDRPLPVLSTGSRENETSSSFRYRWSIRRWKERRRKIIGIARTLRWFNGTRKSVRDTRAIMADYTVGRRMETRHGKRVKINERELAAAAAAVEKVAFARFPLERNEEIAENKTVGGRVIGLSY